jgi:CHAT domain-containing protein
MASSPAVSKTSSDYRRMFETQLKSILRMVPSHDENGFRRGVDEDKVEKLVQSILDEFSAKLSPDFDEAEASLMYETEIERVKQLAKQVMIQNMIFAIFAKFLPCKGRENPAAMTLLTAIS